MKSDKKFFYILLGVFAACLLFACFVPKGVFTNLYFAAAAGIFALAFGLLVKRRKAKSIRHKEVTLVLLGSAALAISLYYITGLGFGFVKSNWNAEYLYVFIIPFIAASLFAEILRRIILSQDSKPAEIISYVCFVVFDIFLYSQGGIFSTYDGFKSFVGEVALPAISANLLYHFLSSRYGMAPSFIYRAILSVYPYIIPVKTGMPSAMYAFFKALVPILILLFVRALYERKFTKAVKKHTVLRVALAVVGVLILTSFVMLISCHFKYGLLVIATESMTGSVNKGDAIIYEQYDNQTIKTGQILVFESDGKRTVHRVVGMEEIDGQLRFYTKGDANDAADAGYVTRQDIIGVESLKIKYLGCPTVWLRELFNK